jgi:hypothetical protein
LRVWVNASFQFPVFRNGNIQSCIRESMGLSIISRRVAMQAVVVEAALAEAAAL